MLPDNHDFGVISYQGLGLLSEDVSISETKYRAGCTLRRPFSSGSKRLRSTVLSEAHNNNLLLPAEGQEKYYFPSKYIGNLL